ncbi:hypothetical protein VTI28DRAFT_1660 [Corynascus sepedonium]
MAGGKWRERLRRVRDRFFHRRGSQHLEASTVPNTTTVPPEVNVQQPNSRRLANNLPLPVIQIAPNQPAYYYPPSRLQDNLQARGHAPGSAAMEVPLLFPPSGLASFSFIGPFYPTRSSSRPTTTSTDSSRQSRRTQRHQRHRLPLRVPPKLSSSSRKKLSAMKKGSSPFSSSCPELSARVRPALGHRQAKTSSPLFPSCSSSDPHLARRAQRVSQPTHSPPATPRAASAG